MFGRISYSASVLFLIFLLVPYTRHSMAIDDERSPGTEMQLLLDTQRACRSVLEATRPYIVRIDTVGGAQPTTQINTKGKEKEGEDPKPNPFRESTGSKFIVADGSTTGTIYSSDGYIVTSSFNFVREPVLISVTLADGRHVAADLIARDQVRKIALLKIEEDNLPTPPWKEREDVRTGEWAIAMGLGLGGRQPAVTVGIVSALQRMQGNAIQTDAKLSPVNYGGPLCDIEGKIIGLCVPMAQKPGELAGVEFYDSGIGFVVPKDRIDSIVETLKTGRSFHRGWLGMSTPRNRPDGVFVANMADPSPMREAGAQIGDRIAEIDGRKIKNFGHIIKATYMIAAGEDVEILLERGDEEITIQVTLARNIDLGPLPELSDSVDDAGTPNREGVE